MRSAEIVSHSNITATACLHSDPQEERQRSTSGTEERAGLPTHTAPKRQRRLMSTEKSEAPAKALKRDSVLRTRDQLPILELSEPVIRARGSMWNLCHSKKTSIWLLSNHGQLQLSKLHRKMLSLIWDCCHKLKQEAAHMNKSLLLLRGLGQTWRLLILEPTAEAEQRTSVKQACEILHHL